jgi:hypothetical protein
MRARMITLKISDHSSGCQELFSCHDSQRLSLPLGSARRVAVCCVERYWPACAGWLSSIGISSPRPTRGIGHFLAVAYKFSFSSQQFVIYSQFHALLFFPCNLLTHRFHLLSSCQSQHRIWLSLSGLPVPLNSWLHNWSVFPVMPCDHTTM